MGSMAEKVEKLEKKSVFVGGGNGQGSTGSHATDLEHAKDVARRYRCEFVDLHNFQLHHDLFTKISPHLMFRYNFVPLEETADGRLAIAIADPSQLMMIDEISLLLGKRIVTKVATLAQMSELDISERRVPQDGRFRVKYGQPERPIDFRVSIMPSIHGEDAVLRVLDKESMSEKFRSLTLDVVGFDEDDLRKFRRYIKEPYGMVLVTGPTGSGKTTTLYAAVNEIKTEEDKIITIEDPVEYQIRGITQIPVNEKKGLTFARGLRSILRHDPDKIMVGEIRDTETAQIAIQSALTGHLVFTTVHANNVVDVLGRFLNMGVEPYNFVSALNCILAQRLVRIVCPSCKKSVRYGDDVIEASGLDPAQWRDVEFKEGEGCIECAGTGYHGRTAIHELLDLSDRIREMILARKPTSEIRRAAGEEGMKFLRESALDKVRLGLTTLKEINKVTFIEAMR